MLKQVTLLVDALLVIRFQGSLFCLLHDKLFSIDLLAFDNTDMLFIDVFYKVIVVVWVCLDNLTGHPLRDISNGLQVKLLLDDSVQGILQVVLGFQLVRSLANFLNLLLHVLG